MATLSPVDTPPYAGEARSNGSGYGSEEPKSPRHYFSLFKSLSGDKKTTKADGQPPKRRGPKPDSKPALTRRQELNRQAQRTHRERKELYIKALEQEVLRLKETLQTTTHERNALASENQNLRDLLRSHGISVDVGQHSGTYGTASSGSISGSYAPGSSTDATPMLGPMGGLSPPEQGGSTGSHVQNGINYDQIGIDFVLTLERPCMDHMQVLCVRSQEADAEISGHALMATCPPASHLLEHPEVQYEHKIPDLQGGDLLKLLDLSNRLPLDGEITPVMAWAMILRDVSLQRFTAENFELMKGELLGKVRCYGFGAVLEEFEVRDALSRVLTSGGG